MFGDAGGPAPTQPRGAPLSGGAIPVRPGPGPVAVPDPSPPLPPGPVWERARVEEPSDVDIATLVGLGFERDDVVEALKGSGNNVEVAANRLMG